MKRRAGCSTKTVDGLIGIADGEDVCGGSSERGQDFDLRKVRILKFVDHNERSARSLGGQQTVVTGEHLVGAGNHVSERAQILFAQPALGGRKYAGNFLAACDRFSVAQLLFRLCNPVNLRLAALKACNVLRIFFRCDQFVVAAG